MMTSKEICSHSRLIQTLLHHTKNTTLAKMHLKIMLVVTYILSSLRVFMQTLRDYKEGEGLRDSLTMGRLLTEHIEYNIALINETPFCTQ